MLEMNFKEWDSNNAPETVNLALSPNTICILEHFFRMNNQEYFKGLIHTVAIKVKNV